MKSTLPGGINYWVAWFLEICAYGAVNCFALISGYVMVNKTIKAKKYNRLMVPDPVLFAVVYIAVFCVFSGKQKCENLGRRGDAGTGKAMVVYICIFCAVFSDPVFKCSDP